MDGVRRRLRASPEAAAAWWAFWIWAWLQYDLVWVRVSLGSPHHCQLDEPRVRLALIIHGSNDLRTGFAQSEMLYKALKQLGRPVEYIRYPNIGHELTRSGPPNQRMDHTLRIVEFFERYAANDRPAPVETK